MAVERQGHILSGRDFYDALYKDDREEEATWLRFGAADKVDTIQHFLDKANIKPQCILELGSGTGAVIEECRRRGLADEFVAVDYSADAMSYLQARVPDIVPIVADVMAVEDPRLDRHFDVVVLSHVLEHLEHPEELIDRLWQTLRFSHLILEVPLEDLPASRLKKVLGKAGPNRAGHVQSFTAASFLRMLKKCRMMNVAERRYVPHVSVEMIEFQSKRDGISNPLKHARHAARLVSQVFRGVYSRLYYAHYGVLCRGNSQKRLGGGKQGFEDRFVG